MKNNFSRFSFSRHTDELVPVLSPVLGLVALGGLVGEHSEAAGQGGADGASHSHPVGPPYLALPQVEGLGGVADVHHPPGAPARGVGEQAQGEQHGREHLHRTTELETTNSQHFRKKSFNHSD